MIARILSSCLGPSTVKVMLAIIKVKWNNVHKIEERIKKAFEAISKLGEPTKTRITDKYLQLKLNELHLAYEYQEKLYQESEEQRQIRDR